MKITENVVSAAALIILISFLFRYYLSDMVGVMAIVAIAFILFYFYSHIFEAIARKTFDPLTKDVQTHSILALLLLLLIGAVMGDQSEPRNAFWIMAIFLSMFLVVKLVLIEYYLRKEAVEEAEHRKKKNFIA